MNAPSIDAPVALTAIQQSRDVCHHIIQWPSIAARKVLPKAPDFSHSALIWASDDGNTTGTGASAPQTFVFRTHDFPAVACNDGESRAFYVAFDLETFSLAVKHGDTVHQQLPLAGVSHAECGAWLETVLDGLGYPVSGMAARKAAPLGGDHPLVAGTAVYQTDLTALAVLRSWYYIAAHAIGGAALAVENAGFTRPSVYLWSHHFDLAALALLVDGDHESVPSIGFGLSPGDGYYEAPYIYVSAWEPPPAEALQAPASLVPSAHWHGKDFTGFVFTADALLEQYRQQGLNLDGLAAYLQGGLIASVSSHLKQMGHNVAV